MIKKTLSCLRKMMQRRRRVIASSTRPPTPQHHQHQQLQQHHQQQNHKHHHQGFVYQHCHHLVECLRAEGRGRNNVFYAFGLLLPLRMFLIDSSFDPTSFRILFSIPLSSTMSTTTTTTTIPKMMFHHPLPLGPEEQVERDLVDYGVDNLDYQLVGMAMER
jgi:hypothetical protein